MTSFWPAFGLAYVAASLLVSAASHIGRPGAFRDVIRQHAIIPARTVPVAAALTISAETTAGVVALVLLLRRPASPSAQLLFAATTAMGVGFLIYIRRLIRRRHTGSGCGCTPWASPVTAASQLPSAALVGFSAAGLVSIWLQSWLHDGESSASGELSVMAPLWGLTLAGMILLVPASMPPLTADGGR